MTRADYHHETTKAELDAIRRRWRTDYDRSADDYTDAGCRVLAKHAFRDIADLLAYIEELHRRTP